MTSRRGAPAVPTTILDDEHPEDEARDEITVAEVVEAEGDAAYEPVELSDVELEEGDG